MRKFVLKTPQAQRKAKIFNGVRNDYEFHQQQLTEIMKTIS